MRIPCPICGPRGHEEFVCHGEAGGARPAADSAVAPDAAVAADAMRAFHDYVYLRANPLGTQRELWYHAAGCECWLLVERDTRNHVIGAVRALRPPADDEAGGAP